MSKVDWDKILDVAKEIIDALPEEMKREIIDRIIDKAQEAIADTETKVDDVLLGRALRALEEKYGDPSD